MLAVPSRVRAGAASVDFFHVRESGTALIDHDVEMTVADPGSANAWWTDATVSTRVLLGIVAVLMAFLLARSAHGASPQASVVPAPEIAGAASGASDSQ